MKKIRFCCIVFLIIFTISCSPQGNDIPTVVDAENTTRMFPTETKQPTEISSPASPAATTTPINTPIPHPTNTLALIGTPLSPTSDAISLANYTQLARIGQWGRGSIQGVSFTPDGKHFIAISELGWSIYDVDALDESPQWVGFEKPFLFDELNFSSDGTLIKFYFHDYKKTETYVKKFPTGETQDPIVEADWLKQNIYHQNNDVNLHSPDETKIFSSNLVYEYNEALFSEEKIVRDVYDINGKLLYSLRDDAPYVSYADRNGPEGCDLSVFSPCGNALMAVATAPRKVAFSLDSQTITILYDPPSLYSGILKAFSYIRVYESSDGSLIGSIGGFTKPVQDFAYSPDGKLLVVGFVDGSLILWDIKSAKSVFGARHMNAPIVQIVYSSDSKYLLIQRGEEVEVRLTTNGNLLYRYDAVSFAVSPTANLLALGDADGNIEIRDIMTGKGIRNIKAHDDLIYSLAFSFDGFYLASSGRDCNIKLWDMETGKLLHYFEETTVDAYDIDAPSRIFSTYLEFVPNKNMLVGFGSWGTVVNWNVNSGATNYVIQSDALQYYNGMITIKPHFPEFFVVDDTNNLFFINENEFDLASGKSLGIYKPPANMPQGCSPVGPKSNDQKLLFTIGYDIHEGELCIINTETMELLQLAHTPWANWVYLSPDGKQLIVTAGSGVMYIFQVNE